MPLADALERLPGLLPPHGVWAVRVGAEPGTLSARLKATAKEFSDQNDQVYWTWRGTLFYLGAVLTVLLSIASFIMMYIIPKYKKIFQDFGTELPALTMWIIDVSDEITQWLPMIALAVMIGLAWLAWRTRHGTTSGGVFRGLLFSHARGHTPDLLRILSIVVQGGRPLVGAVSTMARHHPSATVRNHLLFLRNEIERGGEIWDDLAELGFLKPSESRILEAASRAGNLSWALAEIAGSIERDVDYRTTYVLEIVRPVVLVAVSLAVGIFAIGIFLPLVKLVNDLS
jgi:type IV pilus assembly protein PilC